MKKTVIALMLLATFNCFAQQSAKLQKRVDAGDTKAMVALHHYYVCGHEVAVDTAKAVVLLEQAVSKGDNDAKAWLALYTLTYNHDTTRAVQLVNEAAAAGSLDGKVRKAIWMQDGIGSARNYRRAKQLLEEAVAAGSGYACQVLGSMYLYGSDSCDFDPAKALQLIKKAPEGPNMRKYTYMTDYYSIMGDQKNAVKWMEKGVAMDEFFSQLDAVFYKFQGYGTTEDEQEAMRMLKKMQDKYGPRPQLLIREMQMRYSASTAELRNNDLCRRLLEQVGNAPYADNYNRLGESYLYGQFTEQDSARAAHYWRLGAAKGDAGSMVQLAIFLLNTGKTDSTFYWNDRAVAMGSTEANDLYVRLYSSYALGEPDYAKALPYALESARMGNSEAYVMAGKLQLWTGDTLGALQSFDKAIGRKYYDAYANKAYVFIDQDDIDQGVKWLKQGVKQGSSLCSNRLGDIYSSQENYKEAAKWYEAAKNPEGDCELGKLYLGGYLGEVDDAKTIKGFDLLRRSERAGYRDAIYLMARLYLAGAGVEQNTDSALVRLNRLTDNGDGQAYFALGQIYETGNGVTADTAKAMEYYTQAGDAGYSDGYAYLADFYRHGIGVEPDSAKAFALYQRTVETSDGANPNGLYSMAYCYLRGVGTTRDTAAAIPYLWRALEAGSGDAAADIGDLYNTGRGGFPQDYDSAIFYYHLASKADVPRGDYMMGAYLYEQGLYDNAMGYIASAARNGSVDATVLYAQALLAGNGIEANPEQAVGILEDMVARDTSGQALFMLGIATYNGLGTSADPAKGVRLIAQAADMGNVRAMMGLGGLYADGNGVEKDTVKAVEWYERAVKKGSTKAMMQLAGSYRTGTTAPKDLKRAAELYQMAADAGSLDGLCRLGLCYEEGDGVVLNSRKAFNLYSQAAERGSAWGMRLVAYCYAQGIYVEENMVQAFEWFKKSAEAGDVQSCYILGQLYAEGEGVKKNKKEAVRWLTTAAEAGHPQAAEKLAELK